MQKTAFACLWIAIKIEEQTAKVTSINKVGIVFARIFARREGGPLEVIDPGSEVSKKWNTEINLFYEIEILKAFGFICHVEHPHKMIWSMIGIMLMKDGDDGSAESVEPDTKALTQVSSPPGCSVGSSLPGCAVGSLGARQTQSYVHDCFTGPVALDARQTQSHLPGCFIGPVDMRPPDMCAAVFAPPSSAALALAQVRPCFSLSSFSAPSLHLLSTFAAAEICLQVECWSSAGSVWYLRRGFDNLDSRPVSRPCISGTLGQSGTASWACRVQQA